MTSNLSETPNNRQRAAEGLNQHRNAAQETAPTIIREKRWEGAA